MWPPTRACARRSSRSSASSSRRAIGWRRGATSARSWRRTRSCKIFLTASPEARAIRRATELATDWRTVLKDQALRDEQDRNRQHSPLRAAVDAIELDTTDRTVEDVTGQIVGLVRKLAAKT